MKKLLAIILAVLMLLSLCACGGKVVTATIVTNDGETVQKTRSELSKEYEENRARYIEKYDGASITFVGTVESVSQYYDPSYNRSIQEIDFDDGFELKLLDGSFDDIIIDLSKGDKLKVTTNMHLAGLTVVYLYDFKGSGSTMVDKSTIAIEK